MKVYPHQFVSNISGRSKLDIKYNPLLVQNSKAWRQSATVSRYNLERQVLAEHAATANNDPRTHRLWARFHKELRADWAQNGGRTDRVPIALALGFCVEAVRAREHSPQVLPVAVSLLATARANGLGKLDAPASTVHVRPEIDFSTQRGVFAGLKGLTTVMLRTDADAAINRGDYDSMIGLLQAVHQQVGKFGSTLVTKSNNKISKRKANTNTGLAIASVNSTNVPRTPFQTARARDVATAVKTMSQRDKAKCGWTSSTQNLPS